MTAAYVLRRYGKVLHWSATQANSMTPPTNSIREKEFVAHKDLEDCVGQATAAFGLELLGEEASVPAGVHFPAELGADARANILRVARENALGGPGRLGRE